MLSSKRTYEWSRLCRDCQRQRVSKRISDGRIINDYDGVGGKRGNDHICPDRLKSGSTADLERIKKIFVCGRCKKEYSGKYVDCPDCFKLVCQNCGTLHDWRLDMPRNTCIECGHKYLSFELMEGFKWEKVIAVHVEKQIFDCNTPRDKYGNVYGHIIRLGDKNCRVCGEEV